MNCNTGAAATRCERSNANSDPDLTPFYQEIVTDGTYTYYHDIIGDPNSDFAVEYFVRAGSGSYWGGYTESPINASGGTFNGGIDATPISVDWNTNFQDPLDSDSNLSGNGTGNPERVIFRMIVRDAEMELDVSKTSLSTKPTITQIIDDGNITSTFIFDMSNIGYNDDTTNGIMTNHLVVTGPDLPYGGIIDTDIVADSQFSNISGGKYTYTPDNKGNDGSNGVYNYADGNFDVQNVDWSIYWDPAVNVPNTN